MKIQHIKSQINHQDHRLTIQDHRYTKQIIDLILGHPVTHTKLTIQYI